jgi:GTP cyclohydrolase IA
MPITMTYNASAMQDLVRQILAELGENPDREGLLSTPRRVEKSLKFLTSGYAVDIEALINQALFTVDYSEMVIVKDIDFYSLCEHHLLPFFGKCHVAYLPRTKVIGLSKILGVAVVMEGTHLCMAMRGVEKQQSSAVTSAMLGTFREDARTRSEFLTLVRHR